jgi:hypothetical protein
MILITLSPTMKPKSRAKTDWQNEAKVSNKPQENIIMLNELSFYCSFESLARIIPKKKR